MRSKARGARGAGRGGGGGGALFRGVIRGFVFEGTLLYAMFYAA
jgi:hypothetical protein